MTVTTRSLPLRAAEAVTGDLSTALAVPPRLDDCDGDSPRWRHQSLSKGAAGVAILHAVRAQAGHGGDDRVHAWLTRAVVDDLSVGPGTGLWFGAPAVAFAVATSAPQRCRPAMTRLGTAVADPVQARLHAALARTAAAARPLLSEFDLVRGLTGLGAHLLHHDPDIDLVRRVLDYLVRLTEPVGAHDDAGPGAPGWWTNDAPSGQPEASGGHADLGMAHGISGPLALLALAMRRGITVAGHAEAIDRICHWLDTWGQQAPAGPWWPERISLADLRTGRPSQRGPARPSWCYGTPGLARAQQLSALARGDHARQAAAEQALAACVADPAQLARIIDPNLCHGWAGLAATVWYAAADAVTPALAAHLPLTLRTLIDHADITSPLPGLIEGRAGVALTLHTIATATPSGWPACLLINRPPSPGNPEPTGPDMTEPTTTTGWRQLNLTCDHWQAAEQMALTQLRPLLTDAEDAGILTAWWFVRKGDTWRVRLRPATPAFIDQTTTALLGQETVRTWSETIYEPETPAFGGPAGMDTAPRVEAAFRVVPRHLFLPGIDLDIAYGPKPVVTRRAAEGTSLSSASSPKLVATMLEQLAVQPGHRVLEIGAATGINAALLAELVGPTGTVLTIELDEDLAAAAAQNLQTAGYPQVTVLCGDGALGYPAHAPYEWIIVTAEAWDLVSAWWDQLSVGGRLVVPLRLHDSGLTRALAFDLHQPDQMVSTSAVVCGFVPLRGATEHAEHHVRLAEDVVLKLDAADLPDHAALARTLTHPAQHHWTGIHVRHDEPAEHLDLWLATTASNFARLTVGAQASTSGLADPARRWAGAARYDGGTLAYLAARELNDDVNELGVIVHGPDSAKLAAHTTGLLTQWDHQRPSQPTITAHRVEHPTDLNSTGARIVRPHTLITIAW